MKFICKQASAVLGVAAPVDAGTVFGGADWRLPQWLFSLVCPGAIHCQGNLTFQRVESVLLYSYNY